MSEKDKKLVRQTVRKMRKRGNLSIIDERIVSEYLGHSSITIHGSEGAKRYVSEICSALPDFQYTVEDELTEADRVVHR